MVVAGKSVVAVREGDTIDVYDAVTSVLRLSLKAPRGVTMAEGSSDGSLLVCARHRSHEITQWDMQTGGLINTFATKFEINEVLEVENGCGGLRFLGEPVVSICWLDPEDQVALALKGTVMVLEVTTEKTLYTLPVGECVRGLLFPRGKAG